MWRLRCDRALPACGNCVNRGDITACCYVARKPEARSRPEELSLVSDRAQARIDHLEQLVLTLLKTSRSKQNQVNTPSTSVDVDVDVDVDADVTLEEADVDHYNERDAPGTDNQTTTISTRPVTVINITSDLKERLSVNEAHWALLLNEVGAPPSSVRN